jgi:exonuclease VII large subunit
MLTTYRPKIATAVATILGISTLVLAVQAGAEWQYTDGKGQTHTVVLKMDVPSQFANTARQVDTWQPRVQPGPSDLPTPTPNAPSATSQERLQALQRYQQAQQEAIAKQKTMSLEEMQQNLAETEARVQALKQSLPSRDPNAMATCFGVADSSRESDLRNYGVASKDETYATYVQCMKQKGLAPNGSWK